VLALATAIVTGAVGYVYGVANDIRKARLAFVNAQIERLYGPLYAATQANAAVRDVFIQQHWRDQEAGDDSPAFFDDHNPPTVEQVRPWRHWMRTVFQPLNLRMEEAIIAAWGPDDFADCGPTAPRTSRKTPCAALTAVRNTAGLNHPEALVRCVADDYVSLKRHQQSLQGGFLTALFAANPTRSARSGPGSEVIRRNPQSPPPG
jgi:hypothetical protein